MSIGSTSKGFKSQPWYIWYKTDPIPSKPAGTTYVEEYDSWNFPVGSTVKPKVRPLAWTSGTLKRVRFNTTSITTFNRANGVYAKGAVDLSTHALPLVIETYDNRADATAQYYKARAKVGSGPVNLAENIGDSRKTAEMIAKRVRQIAEAAKQLRNGNLRGLYQALHLDGHPSRRESARVRNTPYDRRLADHWLEYTYGWKPLVNDVHGAIELYRQKLQQKDTIVGRMSHGRPDSGRGKSNGDIRFPNPNQGMRQASGYFSGRLSNPSLAQLNGTGLLNPALLYWELMPYSFVVDWFIPVGDVLASLTAGLGLEGCVGGLVYVSEQSWIFGGYRHQTQTTVNRVAVNGLPAFIPINKGISEQSWQHVVSAVSLLAQRFR